MIHKLSLESPERISAAPARTSQPGNPDQIWLTHTLSDFNNFWPRSQQLKAARCYAFQCADILEVRCKTIALARKIETLFVAVLDAERNPLMLLPLGIERRHEVRAEICRGVMPTLGPVLPGVRAIPGVVLEKEVTLEIGEPVDERQATLRRERR